jgi:hypothetical protein
MAILAPILQSFRNAASYHRHELAAPRAILLPDEEKIVDPVHRAAASYPALWSPGALLS